MDDTERNTEIENGYDNLAVTNDEGRSQRPDLVISVQPQHQGIRREVPVSTINWQSNPRDQFIPLHGLDFLIGVSSLLIQQTVEIDDNSENRYIVRVPRGEALYIASEVSCSTQRCLCGSGRSFKMHLHDNTRQEAMMMTRRLASASCCFPCRLQEMKVVTPPGDYVGRVHQKWTCVVPFFHVRDLNDDVLFTIEGPAVMMRSALVLSEFKILSPDGMREVGRITHGWDRDLVSFVTTLQIPSIAVQPKHKALLLAAAFLLSLETYKGQLVRDTMHGVGTYYWRFYGPEGNFYTYEGHVYANRKHGYGVQSYPDGRVFEGLFNHDVRWGPGIETHVNLKQDVGLWYNNKLIRLAWRPMGPSVVPDFQSVQIGRIAVNKFRKVLSKKIKIIGEVNNALELLKQSGCEPQIAAERWEKLYPKHCNDLSSQLCHVDFFDKSYYHDCINFLEKAEPEEYQRVILQEEGDRKPSETDQEIENVYAWNNNDVLIHMMKYSYQQEKQRKSTRINITKVLSGPRNVFKKPGVYENFCRNLLMACYLGRVEEVTQFVLDHNVNPDISDVQGNSAIMYAACGDQPSIIHFLVESGGNVDGFNDSCCTPLGVTLTRFVCISKDVSPSKVLEAVLPAPTDIPNMPVLPHLADWKIIRDVGETKREPPTKTNGTSTRKVKTISTQIPSGSQSSKNTVYLDEDDFILPLDTNGGEIIENAIKSEFIVRTNELYIDSQSAKPVEYLFQVNDIAQDADSIEEEVKKSGEKKDVKKAASRVIQETTKPSKDQMYQEIDEEVGSMDSASRTKKEMLQTIQATITQLLIDGANPKLVNFPQPALFIALISGKTELIQQLVDYGADINEHYPELFNYTPLDIAVSQKFTTESIEVIRTLLEQGADASHRLDPKIQESSIVLDKSEIADNLGPTLLHAVILRKVDSELDEEKRQEVINLLLEYNCDPLAQYRGISAIELCMTRSKESFNTLIRHPCTNLNGIINSLNQSILVKMFSPIYFRSLGNERIQLLTNLLLHGADPLIPCQNEEETYKNLFVFAKKTLESLGSPKKPTGISPAASKSGMEAKKPKKEEKKGKGKPEDTKQFPRTSDEVTDYREALELVTSCARILHIRWLQAKLFKELAEIVNTFKHRMWNMIIKEHHHKISLNIWVSVQRGLEIWDTLSKARHKIYHDKKVLKYTLYIVRFYEIANTLHKLQPPFMTITEKVDVETYVNKLLRDYKLQHPNRSSSSTILTPELTSKNDTKFHVCFECTIPLEEKVIACRRCKLVYFCSKDCIIANCGKGNTHPCTPYLKATYGVKDSSSPGESFSPDSMLSPTEVDISHNTYTRSSTSKNK